MTLELTREEAEALDRSLLYAKAWIVEMIGEGDEELPKIAALRERLRPLLFPEAP